MRHRHALAVLLAGAAILAAAACGDVGARPNNEGNEAYEQEDYAAAQSSYQEAIEKSPGLPEPHYNSGNVYYQQGQNGEAQESYNRALLDADDDLYRNTLFNQGNTRLRSGEIEEAIESYKDALRLDPTDQDAKHNLEVALSRLPPVEQQQPQDGQPGDQQPQQDGQQEEQQQEEGDQQDEGQQQEGEEQGEQQPQQDQGGGDSQQDQQPPSQPQPQQQPTSPAELTPEQARQLLAGVGDQTDTLQNQMQRSEFSGVRQPEQDW